ncbi:MAG: T9SS type A sorting domain-containing protein [Prevotellaceae bacterium]|nr:T9SS type A sorting domain-containing protein [Prevotellaceae bacterium]
MENDGSAIVDLRKDAAAYPSLTGWSTVLVGEEWDVDFGEDMRGGTAYLICRDSNKMDTVRFYIRGKNPTAAQIKNYMTQTGYYPQYWFIIKMTRQESSMRQFGAGSSYKKTKRTSAANANASGRPMPACAVPKKRQVRGDREVKVYPNPSSGTFYVAVKLNMAADMLIELYSVTGALMRRIPVRSAIEHTEPISFAGNQASLYMVLVRAGSERKAVKILRGEDF